MKVVVGQNTIVKKITVGTPLRVGSAANGSLTGLDDVNGSVNLAHDTILQYDSASGKFKHVSPAALASDGLTVAASGMGSLSESGGTLTYVGPSTDSITTLFNATYDSNSFGTLTQTGGTTHLVGPTAAQIRGLFSGANSLNYNQATGEFSVTVPSTSAGFDSDLALKTTDDLAEGSNLYYTDSRGRAAITVSDAGGFGSLTYNSASGQIVYTGPSETETRSVLSVGDNLAYDSATGKITFTGNLGGDFGAGDAQAALTVSSTGDYGSLSYNSSTGLFTHVGVNDSDIRGAISAAGDLNYNQSTGIISFTQKTDAQIRALFTVSGDLGYDTATGVFSVDLGSVDVTDSAVTRALFSVTNDAGDYGALAYDAGTGIFTFNKVTDSDIRGSITATNSLLDGLGSISFNENDGTIQYTGVSPQEIRNQFSASGDLQYNSTTGQFSITTGAHYTDSDARNVFSVNFVGDTAFDSSPYGGASYNASTGLLTISGTTDSNIRNSLTVQDSGGLGSLTYNTKQGRIVYTGPGVSDVSSLLSATTDSLSMGKLTLDSSKGQFTLKLEDDSVRALFSVVSDQEGGTNLTYNQETGVFTHSGPSTLDLRSQLSIVDAGGDGSFTYFESGGVFTYTGPSPAEVRAHFEGGLGIDYNEATGTFRLDSSANIVTGSIVTGKLTVTDSAVIDRARIVDRLNVSTIASLTDSGDIDIIAGDDVEIVAGDKINLLASNLSTSANVLRLLSDDSNLNNINGGGLLLGSGSNQKSILHQQFGIYDQFVIGANTGLHVPGYMTGRTIDSINKRIDELPDSAQMKGILSAGPGLSYDNTNGIYRIISSGVTAGTYGDATNVSQLTVDSLGIVTSAVDVPISTVNNFTYDSATGNLKITTATDSFNVGITLDPYSTANLVEDSTNLYYTTARADSDARAAISAGLGLDYNELTGTFRVDSTSDITLASAAVNHIDYNVSYAAPWKEGRVFYDSDTKAISYYNDKNDVTINVGQEFVVRVYNDTASPLYNGRAVHFNGRIGDTPTVRLSQGNSKLIARVDGVLTSTIQPGGFGYVTRLGFVNGINTNGLTEGAELYLATDSLGGFTTIEPSSETDFPFHVGRVIVEDSTQGRILVDPYTEFYEQLRVTDHLHVDSEAHIPIIHNDRIAFNTTRFTDINVPENLPSFKEGNLFYFQGPDALTYSNEKINIKLGQDEVVRVYNNTGLTIGKGKVVYITGATNDFPTIALAKSDNIGTVYETQGLTSNEIANGEYGYVTVRGLYGGLNTSNFNVGDIVHVSPDSAGELVNYSPQYPNYPFEVGIVLVSDSASGGNVGGCIQVGLRAEVFENIRVVGNSRFDADVTIAGNLNLLGSETQTKVTNLAVSDNFVFLAAGDTVTAQALDSGLDDLTFIGTYTGDSDLAYYVKIQDADVGGDILVWSFDSNFASLEPFESAGGPTLWNLTTNGLTGDLRHGISFEFEAATGHDSAERWRGDAAPSNLDLGLVGNYNPPDGPFARAGAFRDNADGRFKFFEGYTSTIGASINTSDSSYQDANIQFGTGYGDIVGNVTGNVTGQVSDISNHNTSALAEDPAATDSSGTQYFTSARSRAAIQAVDAGGDGSFVYDSTSGTMTYTGPSEAEFFQHFKDNNDSLGDLTFDSAYGSVGGFKLHERHILRQREVYADSMVNNQEYFLMYSGTTGGNLVKVRGDTMASKFGGGGGGAGGGLFGYINM